MITLLLALTLAAKPADISRVPAKPAKLRVVNIWATWCVPCVHEMDDLRELSKTKDVDFAGISMDDVIPGDRKTTRNKVEKFLASKRITYPNYYYTGAQNALVDAFDFSGELPVTIVYDRAGKELFRVQGAIEKKTFGEKLNQLLKR